MFVFISAPLVWADDQAASVDSLKKRAAQGDAEAQNNLGVMYRKGQGVPQDYAEAAKWYRQPAAQGDAKAQLNLGIMYAKGRGVAHDDVQAYTWFDLAAANVTTKPHHDKAVKARDTLAARMTPAQIAEAPKLAREWKEQ
jgi:TPR repeat protein